MKAARRRFYDHRAVNGDLFDNKGRSIMKPNRCNTSDAEDFRFDRLVDGEMTEAQRRELLAGLDGEPGGWRGCALAFLESQCWKQALGAIAQEGALGEPPAKPLRPARSPWPGRLGTLLAMAASFLAAFWVGSSLERARLDRRFTPAAGIGEVASNADTMGLSQDVAQPPSAVQNRPGQPGAAVPHAAPSASSPWRMVRVSAPAGSGNAGATLRLPAVERDNIDQQWLRRLPPAIPDDVMRAFSRTGHRIEQHRELVPVPLQDGRRLVVPVDQVDVHYIGNEAY